MEEDQSRSSPEEEMAENRQADIRALVKAAVRGDDEAFYALMKSQKVKLYRVALGILGNEPDALEAIQETTFRAYTKLHKLQKPEFFGTWVMRILINCCNDELKRKSRQAPWPGQKERGGDRHAPDPAKVGLEQALGQLAPKERQIIILKYFEDWTIGDIAKAMKCPDSTVKTWLYKALRGLRRTLSAKEDWI